jgi:eukaryotic-like serine/threonine-protein kinase
MDNTIDDPLLGALVDGRYRVSARVARGGMATVYTAVDERLERTVALKIIHSAQANDPRFVGRFTSEAKMIARLTHPNVVAVYDQGSYQGLAYLVMEYVRGKTLRDLLTERNRLDPADALAILEQMLAAIAAAHRAGLVHRDVKPENVLVAESPGSETSLVDGVVKVADFGLAQAVEASTEGAGHLMATAAYVAPELVSHGHADPRTDVYSAGIVLFEMLTGRVPYEAAQPVDVAWQHVQQDVPAPSQFIPGLPAVLDNLVTRSTSRDPGNRPTDAGAMLTEVQAVHDVIGATPARSSGYDQHTMVVPRLGGAVAGATTVIGPIPGRHSDSAPHAERPSWARLPSAKPARSTPQNAPQGTPQGTRHGSPQTGTLHGSPQTGTLHGSPQTGTLHGSPQPSRRRASATTGGGIPALLARVKRDPRARIAVIAGFAVLVLLVGFGVWWLGSGRYTTTPTLVNLPKATAMTQAQHEGFTVKLGVSRFDEKLPKDTVLEQTPTAGARIVSGGTITVVLSKGPERYELPDETGKPFTNAQQDLQAIKLTVKRTDAYDDNIPKDSVISTDPLPDTAVKPGAVITVVVSKGRAPLTVPNVVGQNVSDAQNTLSHLGLTVVVNQQDSNLPKDQVISQVPGDGSSAEKGATITLSVSKGPPLVTVPDVRNQNTDDATKTLQGLGLQTEVFGGGTVRFQNPQAGNQVQPGTKVQLWAF